MASVPQSHRATCYNYGLYPHNKYFAWQSNWLKRLQGSKHLSTFPTFCKLLMARSTFLVVLGGLTYLGLYVTQAVILSVILARHLSSYCWFFVVAYLPSIILMGYFLRKFSCAEDDETVRYVWAVWLLYVVIAFVPVVTVVFFTAVDKLDTSETLGPNALRSMLCFAPCLLILLLNVAISPDYWEFILTLSVTAALDLFDGIEMLEIILLQKGAFDLSESTKIAIIVLACFSFVFSPLSLIQYKIAGDDAGYFKARKITKVCRAVMQALLINLPFLVLRVLVWADHGYESTVFIAKNIISLVVGILEICSGCDLFKCGPDDS